MRAMWARAHRNDVDERRLARVLQADECQLHLLLEEEAGRRERSRVREVGVGGACAVAACLRSQLSTGSSHDWNHAPPAAAIAFNFPFRPIPRALPCLNRGAQCPVGVSSVSHSLSVLSAQVGSGRSVTVAWLGERGYRYPWTQPPAGHARPVARCWPSLRCCPRPSSSTADVASLYLRHLTFSRRTVPRWSPPRSRPWHGGWIEPTGPAQRRADGLVVAVDAAPADEQPRRSDAPRRSSRALVQEQGLTTSRSCRQRSAGTCRPQR